MLRRLGQRQPDVVIPIGVWIGPGQHEHILVQAVEPAHHLVKAFQNIADGPHVVFQPQGMISRCQFKLKHRVPIPENIILKAQGIGEFQPIGLIEWHLAVDGQAAAADLPGIVVLFAPDHDAVQPILRHMECPFDVLPGGAPVDPPHHVHPNLAAGYRRIQRAGIVAGGIEGFVGRKGGVFPLDMNGFGRLAGGVSLADLRIGRLVLFLIKADAVQGHGLPHRLQAQRILPFLQVDSRSDTLNNEPDSVTVSNRGASICTGRSSLPISSRCRSFSAAVYTRLRETAYRSS